MSQIQAPTPKGMGGKRHDERNVVLFDGPSHPWSSAVRLGKEENKAMTGIQFVTDAKGRKVAVQIDLRKHRAIWEDFWDGLVSESRRKEKGIPYEEYRAKRKRK
jgi:hypothetical protein